jgi:hypothetical protein
MQEPENTKRQCVDSYAHCRSVDAALPVCLFDREDGGNTGWSNRVPNTAMVCELLVSDRGCEDGSRARRLQAGVVVIDPARSEVRVVVDEMWSILSFHGYAGRTVLPEGGRDALSSALPEFPQTVHFREDDARKALAVQLGGLEHDRHLIVHARLCVDQDNEPATDNQ